MTESRSPGRYLAPAIIACAAVTAPHAAELTLDRLFDAPALSGPTISGIQVSPDGSRIGYLQGNPDDKNRLDLWTYNIRDGEAHVLVNAAAMQSGREPLSDEELSRRERQRTAAFSGVLEYSFAPSGQAVLFQVSGDLFYYDLTMPSNDAVTKIARFHGDITDAKISPKGRYIAYVRDQNVYTYDLERHQELAVTRDGRGPIKNGIAEFVAQEEMGRTSGYWWSPDGKHIAFAQVDEAPVKVTQRFEISADNVATFAQRYPVAGGANVAVRLGIAPMNGGATTWIDLGSDTDVYLARVNWLPDGNTIAIQRESRDQRRLDLLFADTRSGKTRTVLTETSNSWVELNDELTFLKNASEFVWASARDGFQHLYLYDYRGHLIRRLTAGDWMVNDLRGRAVKAVDEINRMIYFTATEKTPLERQLYTTSLDTTEPHKITRVSQEDGLHGIVMSADARFYVDTFSNPVQPPQVSLRDPDGHLISHLLKNEINDQHPDAPFLADNSAPEFGTLNAADGQLLHYRLYKPSPFDPHKRYPAIVDVYGGPGAQRVLRDWNGDSFTQILTRSGYVVFQLDNRGSAFRGVAFESPIHKRLGEVEVSDQVQGARWLNSQSFVDPSRIGVWGWSYGGYMTLMLMFKAPDIFRAGVSGAPVTDWALYDTHYTERYLEKPAENPAGYEASSVFPYAENLRGRLLVIHGMADDNVLFLHSTKLFRKLQDIGKPFDVMVYPGAKHGLLRQHDGRHALATILGFFNQNLGP